MSDAEANLRYHNGMCGRYTLRTPANVLVKQFNLPGLVELPERFNIAPTQSVLGVRAGEDEPRAAALFRWGLVPSWAKDPAIGNRMINARAETVAEKPSFRSAFRHRRCVVLADGFYEWHRQGDTKIPHFISLASGEPFALAGLWENWKDRESGETMQTTALLTLAANEFMQPLHHRMPVILRADTADDWLSGTTNFLENAAERTPKLCAWPVSRQVNNARNQGEALIDPAGEVII
jgi:putative SOS response-associated peptidase YedK